AAIQRSQASNAELSRELGINPKTVAKWRKRQTVEDRKTGPKEPRSTVLSEDEEAVVVAFRRHTLLPLDDCLHALQPTIPHLTRSKTPSGLTPYEYVCKIWTSEPDRFILDPIHQMPELNSLLFHPG
ncbi:helix-turn-helix domain-containing protein, partial [Rhodovulum sulfidophilum]|nr:helix-turn-helix domain-containing protein [Rhodovulum sulfidophilum]